MELIDLQLVQVKFTPRSLQSMELKQWMFCPNKIRMDGKQF